ncbi:MAG: protein kinase [Anaerolineales bacterium]|nr:protein kinase [Anaerolineales bacterium]
MASLENQTLLKRYFLRKLVGAGGMADVYLAWDSSRSTQLAVKVLRPDLVHNPRFFQQFAKEAELLRRLEHPNIVRLYEFERQGDITFLVMDWVDGNDLRQTITQRKRPYPPQQAAEILGPVCSAMHYAHQNGVFHCDVKPANILLHKDGRVLLTDFGVARLASEHISGGTPAYMAPEQFQGGTIDARTDVYALGVTLYEMLSGGNLPFSGKQSNAPGRTSRDRIAWEHLNLQAAPPSSLNAAVPPAVDTVILTALSKNAADRFPTAMALRESFDHALSRPARRETGNTVLGSTILQPGGGLPAVDPPQHVNTGRRKNIRGPHLIGRRGELAGQAIAIPARGLSIGRGQGSFIRLRERSVSRMHASIIRSRSGVFVRDEGSSLGTFVNGNKISGPTKLKPGDVIRVGYGQEFEFGQ